MKPFNLKEAKAGKPVVTRGRHTAIYIASPPQLACEKCKHIFLIEKTLTGSAFVDTFTDEGCHHSSGQRSFLDLFMRAEKKILYCTVWQSDRIDFTLNADCTENARRRFIETMKRCNGFRVIETFEKEVEV